MPRATEILPADRARHLGYLLQITQLPSASGREDAVSRWVKEWAALRPDVFLDSDRHGNITIRSKRESSLPAGARPIYFTAHMDHPAFVVERIIAPAVMELSFRGGVMDGYFTDASIVIHSSGGAHAARLFGPPRPADSRAGRGGIFKYYTAELAHNPPPGLGPAVGDVGVWDVGAAEVIDGNCHTLACDDLAALAAAISTFECLPQDELTSPVRLLFTRAEEVGFVGAIGACRDKTMPMDAVVIALENSRSFADSPIGGGPIVRVGDRLSIFSPGLTGAVAKRAEQLAGAPGSALPLASGDQRWVWQRKLMAGGACEAGVYCAYGYESTCICLPLGNYHNMAGLAQVQAGEFMGTPRVAREFISTSDYHGLVDLLVACGIKLPPSEGNTRPPAQFDKLWDERSFVL